MSTKRRYMIRVEVLEIDEEGEVKDIPERYRTELAIGDAQWADWVALCAVNLAEDMFSERGDSSPVTPDAVTQP